MAYLGQVDRKASNVQVFNVTSSTSATHDIGWTPPSEQTLIVTINGVKQHTNAFSFSGSTLTLGAALVATDELEVVGINDIGNSLTPVDNSVTTSKLGADAVTTVKIQDNAVTLAKMSDGTQGGVIHYGAAGAPVELAAGTDGYFLKTQGAGANPVWASAGGNNSPRFSVKVDAPWDLSNDTWTIHPFDTAAVNDDGASGTCFNITGSGTNPRGFTVPAGEAGIYLLSYHTVHYVISGAMEAQMAGIYKGVSGGTAAMFIGEGWYDDASVSDYVTLGASVIVDAAVGDHYYVYSKNTCGDTAGRVKGGTMSNFSGFKLL